MTPDALDTEIIARIHDALNRRDFDAIGAELTDDVVFHPIPGLGGPLLEGREAVLQQFEMMAGLGDQRVEHLNAESLAGYVVGIGTVTLTVAGAERTIRLIDMCRLRDGKLAERWAMFDDPDELQRILADVAAQTADA